MLAELLALVVSVQPADTLHIPIDSAFHRAVEHSFEISSATSLAEAAAATARQARALPNPGLSLAVENIGRAREITGIDAPRGLEGQVYLESDLPFGPTRSGTIASADAVAWAAESDAEAARLSTAERIVTSFAALLRSDRVLEAVRFEESTLRDLRDNMELRAEVGTAAAGDAARIRLEHALVVTRLGRLEAERSDLASDAARRIGVDPGEPFLLDLVPCPAPGSHMGDEDAAPPSVERARARVAETEARIRIASARALPDVAPQIGLRRGAGFSSLYLGLQMSLPVLNRGGAARAAAEADRAAAESALLGAESLWRAESSAAAGAVEALERAGLVYGDEWIAALESSVTASERRYEVGEGTLAELLDRRRARLRALEDRAVWLEDVRIARARLARIRGTRPGPDLLCPSPLDGALR